MSLASAPAPGIFGWWHAGSPEGKRARYVLTDSARALVPVFEQMAGWSSTHLFADGEVPQPYGHFPPL